MTEVSWETPFSKNLCHIETSQSACNQNRLIEIYMTQAFNKIYFPIDFSLLSIWNLQYLVMHSFKEHQLKMLNGFYWLLAKFFMSFLKI